MVIISSLKAPAALNEGQQMIYGRRRLIDVLHERHGETFASVQAKDIINITLEGDQVNLQLEDTNLFLLRKDVIENFWSHRTRTPSYFDYKIWSQIVAQAPWKGVPIAALDYSNNSIAAALESVLGRVPKISTTKEGEQRLYFVEPEESSCSCQSWQQMDQHQEHLDAEFNEFTKIKFAPTCKHLQWYKMNMELKSTAFINAQNWDRENKGKYNPRICVYRFDHRTGLLQYRATNDGVKANAQWLPVAGWKEKNVYDSNGLPTGECWKTLLGALSQEHPYQLKVFSPTIGDLMSSSRSRQ
jgi:hypothetical protein